MSTLLECGVCSSSSEYTAASAVACEFQHSFLPPWMVILSISSSLGSGGKNTTTTLFIVNFS